MESSYLDRSGLSRTSMVIAWSLPRSSAGPTGRPLLAEGARTLLGIITQVHRLPQTLGLVERFAARQLRRRVHRRLGRLHRERTVGGDGLGQALRSGSQIRGGDDHVDEADLVCALGGD